MTWLAPSRSDLDVLRQIVFNKAQVAFDAVMSAGAENDLRLAREQHPLLGDAAFLDRLEVRSRKRSSPPPQRTSGFIRCPAQVLDHAYVTI